MKILLTLLFTGLLCFAQAQIHVDSARIVQLDDTLYGVALYGALMTCPAVIIDSSKQIANDTINLSICYLQGDALNNFCKGYDTILLGALVNTNKTIILALACTDTTVTSCSSPQRKDTIVLQYIPTGIINVKSNYSLQLFPNPVSDILNGNISEYTGTTGLQVTSTTGQLFLQNITTQPNFTIDVSNLPPGVYFLQLTAHNSRVAKKFLKR
jgi:hypothetical protein